MLHSPLTLSLVQLLQWICVACGELRRGGLRSHRLTVVPDTGRGCVGRMRCTLQGFRVRRKSTT